MTVHKRPDHEPEHHRGRRPRRHGHDDFFGLDVEKMGPGAQVATSLAVMVPVALSAPLWFTVFSHVWWIFMTYFWVVFPAFGLLVRGINGLFEDRPKLAGGDAAGDKERELLGALREHGELTLAWAAVETSLAFSEADEMLGELAEGGHPCGCEVVRSSTPSGRMRGLRGSSRGPGLRGYGRGCAWYHASPKS